MLGSTLSASLDQVVRAITYGSHIRELLGGEDWLYYIGDSKFVLDLFLRRLQWDWYVAFLLNPLPVGLIHPLPHAQG